MVFDFSSDKTKVVIRGPHRHNLRDILAISDGVVIGRHFKVDGNTWNPHDGARVKRFMDAVAKAAVTGPGMSFPRTQVSNAAPAIRRESGCPLTRV